MNSVFGPTTFLFRYENKPRPNTLGKARPSQHFTHLGTINVIKYYEHGIHIMSVTVVARIEDAGCAAKVFVLYLLFALAETIK